MFLGNVPRSICLRGESCSGRIVLFPVAKNEVVAGIRHEITRLDVHMVRLGDPVSVEHGSYHIGTPTRLEMQGNANTLLVTFRDSGGRTAPRVKWEQSAARNW